MDRRVALDRLYELLGYLAARVGGPRLLRECEGRLAWPERGVYFFFEPGELREDGRSPRVVRVGTHAVSVGSRTTLWNRLSQHRGSLRSGLGNHRGSIFRLHVGTAFLSAHPDQFLSARPTWSKGSNASVTAKESERELEAAVSRYIGAMPFLWVCVDDDPGPTSNRHIVESNVIALLSNVDKPPIDPPSLTWLGQYADRTAIRKSGLWNVNHVHETFNPVALELLESCVQSTGNDNLGRMTA